MFAERKETHADIQLASGALLDVKTPVALERHPMRRLRACRRPYQRKLTVVLRAVGLLPVGTVDEELQKLGALSPECDGLKPEVVCA